MLNCLSVRWCGGRVGGRIHAAAPGPPTLRKAALGTGVAAILASSVSRACSARPVVMARWVSKWASSPSATLSECNAPRKTGAHASQTAATQGDRVTKDGTPSRPSLCATLAKQACQDAV